MHVAKRRIKRFMKDPSKHVARVRPTSDPNVFEYRVKHHEVSLFYKRDKLGRLRQVENPMNI